MGVRNSEFDRKEKLTFNCDLRLRQVLGSENDTGNFNKFYLIIHLQIFRDWNLLSL